MGNINGWQRNFILRCEAVGWSVERGGSDHYKVRDQNGKFLFSFGSTSSDQHALKKTVADAKRAGIEQLETLIKLRNEHDRLTRIEADRAVNDVALARVIEDPVPVRSAVNALGDVNGVAIVATAPAKIKTPIMPKPAPLADAEELLLTDDRVVYRCLKIPPSTDRVCHRIFETADSLRVHMAYHSRKSRTTQPLKRSVDPVEEPEVRQDVKQDTAVDDAAPEPTKLARSSKPAVKTVIPDSALALMQRIETAIKMIDHVEAAAATLKLDLTGIRDDLVTLPVVDPEVTEKARQFDTLRGIFTGQTDS